ncbi:SART-1-domain-containing protein [Lactarius sanguifluus]|nr:SART-1-domain-containing protein [Lactarius sanguifluus]
MEESISLEETNKIRISLGLKPLTDDSAPADDKEKQAETNYAKQREAEVKQKESKVRNKRELNASLNGATLGDADADTDDTLKWIKKSKKREKELAKKRQAELESMDKVFQEEYTEKDLEGLKVSHDFSKLEDGESHILTLKDSRILDNEDDELQNVEMAEAEQTKERNELKIKKRDYTGYDDEEFVDGREGMRRTVLSKYDEFLEGPKDTGFRLGSSLSSYVPSAQSEEQAAVSVNKALLSIDYTKNIESSDYLQKGDVGFKKPKVRFSGIYTFTSDFGPPHQTKKKRPTRRAAEDSDIIPVGDQMEIDIKPSVPRVRDLDVNFIKKVSPEEIARRVAEERARSEEPSTVDVIKVEDGEAEIEGSGGLVFDDTSEFVRGITYDPIVVKREVPGADGPVTPALLKQGIAAEEKAAAEDVNLGVGTKVFLSTPNDDQVDRERVQLQRDLWLAEQRRRVAQREIDRLKARGSNKDQAQREKPGPILEAFKNYKPDVNIVYHDEFGRALDWKEAWKALSHKFHGKGSGKMKTEKRLKKIAEEKKKEAMASGDTPLSMNKAFQIRQEKTGQAHFVLSVAEFLDAQPLSKGKTEKTQASLPNKTLDNGFMTVPAPQAAV